MQILLLLLLCCCCCCCYCCYYGYCCCCWVVLYLVKTEFKFHDIFLTLLKVTVEIELFMELEETQQRIVLQAQKQYICTHVSTLLHITQWI